MDYVLRFEGSVSFTARNEEQGEERANQIGEWLQVQMVLPDMRKRPWLGELEYDFLTLEEA